MGDNNFPVSAEKDSPVRPIEGWTRKYRLSPRETVDASTLLSADGLAGTVVRDVMSDDVLSQTGLYQSGTLAYYNRQII
jgi:hypothetical protein